MNAGVTACIELTRRELLRFVRQPSRIAATVGTPALLWLFLAGGVADSFTPPGAAENGTTGYGPFLLPGMATAVVLFSAIFAAMSLIEDRREGFLQSVLVSPAPRWAPVLAKTIGGGAVATLQAAIVLLAAPAVGISPGLAGFALALVAVALTAITITSVGLALAWWVNSPEGFHGVMNLVLMPMWFLSGSLFPSDGAAGWLAIVMRINPLTWSTNAIRGALLHDGSAGAGTWFLTASAAAGSLALAWFVMARSGKLRHPKTVTTEQAS